MVVDTSVLMRYFTNDDPIKADKFKNFLLSKQRFIIPDIIFAEVYWTLLTFYKQPRKQVILVLESMLGFPSVSCNYQLIAIAIQMVKKYSSLSFVDSYTAAYSKMKSDSVVLSYDKGFSKIDNITRKEP